MLHGEVRPLTLCDLLRFASLCLQESRAEPTEERTRSRCRSPRDGFAFGSGLDTDLRLGRNFRQEKRRSRVSQLTQLVFALLSIWEGPKLALLNCVKPASYKVACFFLVMLLFFCLDGISCVFSPRCESRAKFWSSFRTRFVDRSCWRGLVRRRVGWPSGRGGAYDLTPLFTLTRCIHSMGPRNRHELARGR